MFTIVDQKKFNLNQFLQKRSISSPDLEDQVGSILENIKKKKNKALIEYCKKFDKTD
ncbi:MAG: histidinol dehydrogenase, partial [Spirochaetes bacterium]|nr:histidinol dehydrogenase [Spirochaetota bacterium]